MHVLVYPKFKLYRNCTIVCLPERTLKDNCFKKHLNSKLKVSRVSDWFLFNMSHLYCNKYYMYIHLKYSWSLIMKFDINPFHFKSTQGKIKKIL